VSDSPIISVVIPAYNAASTITNTLNSARAQSHKNLEIVVVDDGSRDSTASLVATIAAQDPRVRLVRQTNAGVARARNRGIAETRAELIAFLDADDLWHPLKLERQLSELARAGNRFGFCYCSFRRVDSRDRVIGSSPLYTISGSVLAQHALVNFVGNGSAILVRRRALEQVGGFDPSLRDQGLEGVEDFDLQLRLAARYHVAVVPAYLVGYRLHAASMSNNAARMARARTRMFESSRQQLRDIPRYAFDWAMGTYLVRCGWQTARNGDIDGGLGLIKQALRVDPLGATATLAGLVAARVRARTRPLETHQAPAPLFFDLSPDDVSAAAHVGKLRATRLRWLAQRDAAVRVTPDCSPADREGKLVRAAFLGLRRRLQF
jgi:glycosyltransferase involved in cell wall biosynthesis